jgi:hypothetical protein
MANASATHQVVHPMVQKIFSSRDIAERFLSSDVSVQIRALPYLTNQALTAALQVLQNVPTSRSPSFANPRLDH